jgi:formylglycine-generating enzyme required for sulfatase activity
MVIFPSQPTPALEKIIHNSIGMEFVMIPAGTFVMGTPSYDPYRSETEVQHEVTISAPFYMQTTEVTLQQWKVIMGKRLFGKIKGPDNSPVTKVSWHDCTEFLKRLNALGQWSYRLPTEAEWEYACRAESTTDYSWGDNIDCTKAMYSNNKIKSGQCIDYIISRGLAANRPAPVKSYNPNDWGLYDMHGNVWEWCQDWFGEYGKKNRVNPVGPESGTKKVRRGGSWFGPQHLCRSANRNFGHPASRYRTTGFRVVVKNIPDLSPIKEGR